MCPYGRPVLAFLNNVFLNSTVGVARCQLQNRWCETVGPKLEAPELEYVASFKNVWRETVGPQLYTHTEYVAIAVGRLGGNFAILAFCFVSFFKQLALLPFF